MAKICFFSSRMEKVAEVGGGSPPSGNKKDGTCASNGLRSGIRASGIAQQLFFKSFSTNSFCILFAFTTAYFSLTCAEANLGGISAQANFTMDGTHYNCSLTGNLICLGDAHVNDGTVNTGVPIGRLSLIKENANESFHNSAIAYYEMPVKLLDLSTNKSASFSTSFAIDSVYQYYNYSGFVEGDGVTFVISADNSILGNSGGMLGMFNSDGATTFKSIVVEFDTFMNSGSPQYDISYHHVSFDFMNITTDATVNDSNVYNWGLRPLYAWVDYSSKTQRLEVRTSLNNSRPITSLLSRTVDLFEVVEEYMWVGFSAASGKYYSNYYVGEWTFESYGISVPTPTPAPTPSPKPTPPPTLTPSTSGHEITPISSSGGGKRDTIIGLSVGIPGFLLACIISLALFLGRGHYKYYQQVWLGVLTDDKIIQMEGMPERFSYKQLRVATRNFSEESLLGQGGFGSVYRGVLQSTGIPVAVKRIKSDSSQGEKEFLAEVSIINLLKHRNLIELLGWCTHASKEKYLLVYELMPKGSLDKVLFGPAEKQTVCLSWQQRFNIVTGTASAIEYLHQGLTRQVIHRDIKASNIMLDEEWNAKLGDFGLARLVDHHREGATTLLAGTCGYIAPEVAATGRFTDKSDVFAFGAVVLEVACGRRALSHLVQEDEMVLVDWVWRRLSEGDLLSTVDKRLVDYDADRMEVVLNLGLVCSHPDPLARPTMRHVLQVLTGVVPVPSIPISKPAGFSFIQPLQISRSLGSSPSITHEHSSM